MSQEWGFTVTRLDRDYEWNNPDGTLRDKPLELLIDPPRWKVNLPHQCDAWAIVEGWQPPGSDPQDWDSWVDGAPQEEAAAILERFIAEAQEALAALKAGQEYGGQKP